MATTTKSKKSESKAETRKPANKSQSEPESPVNIPVNPADGTQKQADEFLDAEQKREKRNAEDASREPDPYFNDLTTQADADASPFDFVTVSSGKHEGAFGVLLEKNGKDALVRERSSAALLSVPYSSLTPANFYQR